MRVWLPWSLRVPPLILRAITSGRRLRSAKLLSAGKRLACEVAHAGAVTFLLSAGKDAVLQQHGQALADRGERGAGYRLDEQKIVW